MVLYEKPRHLNRKVIRASDRVISLVAGKHEGYILCVKKQQIEKIHNYKVVNLSASISLKFNCNMKKIIIVIALLAWNTSFLWAQNVRKLDEKNGFKELTLGASYQELKKYLSETPAESDPAADVAVYAVTDPSFFEVGESDISTVSARFFKDKLESIVIETKGAANSKELLNALTLAYGKGEKRNTYIEEHHWEGKKTAMYYKLTPATKSAKVTISSKELIAMSEKHKKDVKKSVVKDL